MKKIGLIGGMSWASTLEYYRIINEKTSETLGGLHSADCIIHSFDFHEIYTVQKEGKEKELIDMLVESARSLEKIGAECIAICTNTMHKYAEIVQNGISVPLIHIADSTGRAISAKGFSKVGLLGTKYTMEEDFYKKRIFDNFGIDVIIPDKEGRETINRIIYDELCLDKILPESKAAVKNIISDLGKNGAQGVILGCTEIPLIIKEEDTEIPIFNTTKIHALSITDFAIKNI